MSIIYADNGGTIAIFTIFGALVLLMIGIAFFGSAKERNKKRIDNTKKQTSNMNVEQFYVSSFFWLFLTVTQLEDDLKYFKPSVGQKTYKQISDDALYTIKRIEKHKLYNELKRSEKYFPSIEEVLKNLKDIKPQNWVKDSYFAINVIKAKKEAYIDIYAEEYKNVLEKFKKEHKELKGNTLKNGNKKTA